jgi:hypothetical protein
LREPQAFQTPYPSLYPFLCLILKIAPINLFVTVYATAIAPRAAATRATTLFAVSTFPAAPVEVAVAAVVAATALLAATKVAICVIVAVWAADPDTVVATTTVLVDQPVSEAVTVYHPLPDGVAQGPHGPDPPHPPPPVGHSVHVPDVQAEDQEEQTDDWKDQIGAVDTEVGQAATTQLESAEPVSQWPDHAVGSGAKAEEMQELCLDLC